MLLVFPKFPADYSPGDIPARHGTPPSAKMTVQMHLQGDSSHVKRWMNHQSEVSLHPSLLTQGKLRFTCQAPATSSPSPGRREAWLWCLPTSHRVARQQLRCAYTLCIYTLLYIYTHTKSILISILISILTSVARYCMPHILLYSLSLNTHHIHNYLHKVNSEGERERKLWSRDGQNPVKTSE